MSWAPPFDAPDLSASVRLQRALLVALALHLFVIFAIGFRTAIPPRHSLPTLDLVLVHEKQRTAKPEQADALAEQDSVAEPEAPDPLEQPAAPDPAPTLTPPVPPKPAPQSAPAKPAQAKAQAVLTQKPKPIPSAATLVSRSLAMAQLSADVDAAVNDYHSLPRQRHISASTQEFKYAQYMQAWVAKVERVGNLNYPEAARRDNLSGRLILDVVLSADGAIQAIEFVKSSGHKALDDAAVHIVRMAAPYAPFPADIRDETDVLHITRTWEFSPGNRLTGR